MSIDDVWPVCCVINAQQSSVRNEILVENKRRNRISSIMANAIRLGLSIFSFLNTYGSPVC